MEERLPSRRPRALHTSLACIRRRWDSLFGRSQSLRPLLWTQLTPRVVQTEYRCRHKSGSWKWMLGRALPHKDLDGNIQGWVGMCTDIDADVRVSLLPLVPKMYHFQVLTPRSRYAPSSPTLRRHDLNCWLRRKQPRKQGTSHLFLLPPSLIDPSSQSSQVLLRLQHVTRTQDTRCWHHRDGRAPPL